MDSRSPSSSQLDIVSTLVCTGKQHKLQVLLLEDTVQLSRGAHQRHAVKRQVPFGVSVLCLVSLHAL